MLAGAVLFLAASFQQVGLLYTTAGNAGFITGLYVIIVPLFGLFFRHRPGKGVWIGAVLAVCGLYLLSSVQGLMTARGDFLEVICAVLFACHVLIIGRLSPRYPAVPLSIVQFLVCSLLCTLVALGWEEMVWQEILDAAVPILYGGVCSVGIAYTLQVVGQKDAPPGHAAIILSLESAFAFFGGWLLLNEPATARTLSGAGLILAGMLVAQTQRVLAMKKKRRQDGSDAVV
jgi:drug/metabolite transporter (DMT)-like permease